MHVLITGSRDWSNIKAITDKLDDLFDNDSKLIICHGDARGADRIAADYARRMNIPVRSFPANWDKYGKRAGVIRNQQMLDEFKPELVLAFPIASSIGTYDMIRRARSAGVTVIVTNG